VFTDMQDWTDIRRAVLVQGASKRAVCRQYKIAHKTLNKILAHSEPPGYRQSMPRPRIKLAPYLPIIEEILAADRAAPAKQRHTAKRIFERLRDEHGYDGGITQVKVAVARLRRHAAEVFVPLAHEPGRAQFDFGEAAVTIAGQSCKAHFAVMSLPYSDAFFIRAYPRECTESFQDAHTAAFAFFGGVPVKTDYDNSKIAVARIVGRERELTREFLRLEAHFLFAHRFCRVGRGNEKGHVESLVGYGRRNFMVPVPAFASWGEFNAFLEQRCRDDLARQLWGKTQTKAELLADDQHAMLPLPSESFEGRRIAQTRANSLSLVRFDGNDYSVPVAFAHHELCVSGGIEEVRISERDQLVCVHARIWERQRVSFDPLHYLALLERKPGALDVARPLADWGLPDCFALLRRRLESSLGYQGTREYIKVLRLAERAPLPELTKAVMSAVSIGATSSDAIALILASRAERAVSLFCLDGHPQLAAFAIEPPDLHAYAVLKAQGARS
jgi:transposase